MKKIISKMHTKNNHTIFLALSFVFLIATSVIWGVSSASTITNPLELRQSPNPGAIPGTYDNTIYFSWDYNSDIPTYFLVERKTSIDSVYSQISKTTTNNFTDRNVTQSLAYSYQVKACSSALTQSQTQVGGVTPIAGTTTEPVCADGYVQLNNVKILIPTSTQINVADPTFFKVTNTSTETLVSVGLSWVDNSNNEGIFRIIRTSNGVEKIIDVPTIISSGGTNTINATVTYSDVNSSSNIISRDISYSYKIQACTIVAATGGVQTCSNFVSSEPASITIPAQTVTVLPPSDFVLENTSTETIPSIKLTWTDNSNNETKFIIKRMSKSDTTPKVIEVSVTPELTLSNGTTVSYSDINSAENIITRGTPYYYQVQACPATINAALPCTSFIFSKSQSITIPTLLPRTPTVLDATFDSTSIADTTPINLTWIDNSNDETKFVIERRLSTDLTITPTYIDVLHSDNPTGSSTGSKISYSDINSSSNIIKRGVSYYYLVRACALSTTSGTQLFKCSSPSNIKEIKIPTLNNPVIVADPTDLKLVGDFSNSPISVSLDWADNSNNETNFEINRWISGDVTSVTKIFTDTDNKTARAYFRDITIEGDTSYVYKVRACFKGYGSNICSKNFTNSVTIATPPITQNIVTLVKPTELTADITTDTPVSVKLGWADKSTNESYYLVERRLGTSLTSNTNFSKQLPANTISYTDNTDLVRNSTYIYTVKACGQGAGSTNALCSDLIYKVVSIPLITPSTVTINKPSDLKWNPQYSLTPLLKSIELTWIDNSLNETEFRIQRKLSNEYSYSQKEISVVGKNTYTDNDVRPGTLYDYKVRACTDGTATTTSGSQQTICSGYAELSKISIPTLEVEKTPAIINAVEQIIQKLPTGDLLDNLDSANKPEVSTSEIVKNDITKSPSLELALNIVDISLAVSDLKSSIDFNKEKLINLIDESVLNIIKSSEASGGKIDTAKIYAYRDELVNKINLSFQSSTAITSLDVNNLKTEVENGIENLKSIATNSVKNSSENIENFKNIDVALNSLTVNIEDKSRVLKEFGGNTLFKDTNNDGVSDYNSTYVYNIDPIKPSPVSVYEGKNINASEKILLGFDPTKTELVKVVAQQPSESIAPVVSTYKVKEVKLVKLADKNQVQIGGQSLPNSFVTLYIYSTPIIVTIKTDSNGEWKYLLDKELEDGNHTVYTATVNNTGNIVAKSSGYLFTKTAEAITFNELPIAEASVNISKPGLLDGVSLYLAIAAFVATILSVIILIGVISKKNSQNPS